VESAPVFCFFSGKLKTAEKQQSKLWQILFWFYQFSNKNDRLRPGIKVGR
jgi:hypothetical protein